MSETRAPIAASVLVVDDVADNRDLLIRRLNRLDIKQIDQATNGVEALPPSRPTTTILCCSTS